MYLRQSTAQAVRFGPFVDSADGVTPETGLTIAQADMQLSKDGAAYAQKNAVGNATHDTDGWYFTTFDTTDTDTIGELILQVNVAGALPVWMRYWVLDESVYDINYGYPAGATLFTYTVTASGNPLAGASVWITTDIAGNNVIWVGVTDAAGVARDVNGNLPALDPNTYYFWKQLAGYWDDDNPDTEVVT